MHRNSEPAGNDIWQQNELRSRVHRHVSLLAYQRYTTKFNPECKEAALLVFGWFREILHGLCKTSRKAVDIERYGDLVTVWGRVSSTDSYGGLYGCLHDVLRDKDKMMWIHPYEKYEPVWVEFYSTFIDRFIDVIRGIETYGMHKQIIKRTNRNAVIDEEVQWAELVDTFSVALNQLHTFLAKDGPVDLAFINAMDEEQEPKYIQAEMADLFVQLQRRLESDIVYNHIDQTNTELAVK